MLLFPPKVKTNVFYIAAFFLMITFNGGIIFHTK